MIYERSVHNTKLVLIIEQKKKTITAPLIALFLLIGSLYLPNIHYTGIFTWETSIISNSLIFLDENCLNTEYSPSSGFTLNGNNEFSQIATEEDWPGEGTLTNPFYISDLNISGGELKKPLIEIRNTDVHFSIEKCILQNGKISILFSNVTNGCILNNLLNNNKKGIILENSKCNLVEKNSITNTRGTSIFLQQSKGNIITKNRITNTTEYGGYGIYLLKSESCLISHNHITNIKAWAGLWLDTGSDFNTVSSNILYNTNNGNGIIIGSQDGGSHKNKILNNSVYNNEMVGIRLLNSNDNVIQSNDIFQNGEDGVYIERNSHRNDISNNSIQKNTNTGILIHSSFKNILRNNMIYNNSQQGIWVTDSMNTMFFRNTIAHNHQSGIHLTSTAEFSLIMLNGFEMNAGFSQAIDNGVNNCFTLNYWSDKDTAVGFYIIGGLADNKDDHPSIQEENIKEPVRLEPKIIFPNGGEVLDGIVTIKWNVSISIENYPCSIYYSPDGGSSWKLLSSNVTGTRFIWQTPSSDFGLVYLVKIETPAYFGPTETDISDFPFFLLNMPQLIIGLLALTLALFISFFILQKKGKFRIGRIERKPKLVRQQLLISMCLGSYTDSGFKIQRKTEPCHFEEQDLQSMADYCSVLYQHGETERIYGPFPKKIEYNSEITVWLYLSFNFSIKDSSVTDSRIIAQKNMVPVLLLLLYPQKYDIVVTRWKEEIRNLLKNSTQNIIEISDLNEEWLMSIEEQIRTIITE